MQHTFKDMELHWRGGDNLDAKGNSTDVFLGDILATVRCSIEVEYDFDDNALNWHVDYFTLMNKSGGDYKVNEDHPQYLFLVSLIDESYLEETLWEQDEHPCFDSNDEHRLGKFELGLG